MTTLTKRIDLFNFRIRQIKLFAKNNQRIYCCLIPSQIYLTRTLFLTKKDRVIKAVEFESDFLEKLPRGLVLLVDQNAD